MASGNARNASRVGIAKKQENRGSTTSDAKRRAETERERVEGEGQNAVTCSVADKLGVESGKADFEGLQQ